MDLFKIVMDGIDRTVEEYCTDQEAQEEFKQPEPPGHSVCSVKDCNQGVQADEERIRKHPMCYAHRKMENGLFGRAMEYASGDERSTTKDWDLTLKGE